MDKISRLLSSCLVRQFGDRPLRAGEIKGVWWHEFQANRRQARLLMKLLFVSGAAQYDGRKRIVLTSETTTPASKEAA